MTSKQYQQDKEMGRQAARAGKKEADSPFGRAPSLRARHQAWIAGFQETKR